MKLEKCPACGEHALDLTRYHSLMMVSEDKALFRVTCPHCGARTSGLFGIPAELRPAVQRAAVELGTGMGRES